MSGHCVECILAGKSATGDNVSGSHAVDVRGYDCFSKVFVKLKTNKEVKYLKIAVDQLVHHWEILLNDLCLDSCIL